MDNTLEYYNAIAPLLSNDEGNYYNGALLVDLDSDPSTFIDQDVDNIIKMSKMGQYVLECGCGGGYFFKRLIQKKKSVRYYGIDISEEQIKHAKQRNPGYEARFKLTSWDKLPFEDNYFDTILFLETIGYAEDVEQMIKECYRVLKPGGTLFSKHPGSAMPGIISEFDLTVDFEKVMTISQESKIMSDVDRYTQYMVDSTSEKNYDLRTGEKKYTVNYWTEEEQRQWDRFKNQLNPFNVMSPISREYGYSDQSLGMLMNVPAFIRRLEQYNFSVPDGYIIPQTDSTIHLKTFFVDEVHEFFVSRKGNNGNLTLRFKDGTSNNFWEKVIEKMGNNVQMYDILTPLGRRHRNLIDFLFYNVFPMKEDLNAEYVNNASTRQDAASPCIIFKAIKK